MSSPADKCTPNLRNMIKITDESTSNCETQSELRIAHIPPMERTRTELVDQGPGPSPISRLGFDVLSIVFELCSEDDWTSPLRIGVINRKWREVILATPRAWTFIRLDNGIGAKLTNLYFERSGRYLHHIHLNYQSDFAPFRTISHRIQCLTINPVYFDRLSGFNFPNLTRLRLDQGVYLSQVAASIFPALRHLSVPCIVSETLPAKLAFPPLQSLQLVVYSDTAWIKLAQACQNSLLSVTLGNSNLMASGAYPNLCLPRLRALWLTLFFDTAWPMNIKTPELATYVQYHSSPTSCHHLLHNDVSGVTSLWLHYVPSHSRFPKLHTFNLKMGPSNAHLEIMAQLNAGDGICPLLRMLVLNMLGMSPVACREAQEAMGPEHSLDLPEVTKASCGQSMPCTV